MRAIPPAASSVKSIPCTSRIRSEGEPPSMKTVMTGTITAPQAVDVGDNGVRGEAIPTGPSPPGAKRREAEDGNPLPLPPNLLPPPGHRHLRLQGQSSSLRASRRLLLRPTRISSPYRYRCFGRASGSSTTGSAWEPSFQWRETLPTGRPRSILMTMVTRPFSCSMRR